MNLSRIYDRPLARLRASSTRYGRRRRSASKTRVTALMAPSLTSSSTRTETLSKRSRPLSKPSQPFFSYAARLISSANARAVDQRTGDPCLIIRGTAGVGPAAAGKAGFAGSAAAARIHRPDQHEARRIGDAMIGARNGHFTGLQRLAQRIERLRLELRNYVAVSPTG
jgi:hypothetical protein